MQNFALIKIITNSQPEIRDKKRHEKKYSHAKTPPWQQEKVRCIGQWAVFLLYRLSFKRLYFLQKHILSLPYLLVRQETSLCFSKHRAKGTSLAKQTSLHATKNRPKKGRLLFVFLLFIFMLLCFNFFNSLNFWPASVYRFLANFCIGSGFYIILFIL